MINEDGMVIKGVEERLLPSFYIIKGVTHIHIISHTCVVPLFFSGYLSFDIYVLDP